MFNVSYYAGQIKTTVQMVFKCDDRGVGGLADIKQIEKDPFHTMLFVLGNYYNKLGEKGKKDIDLFVSTYLDQFNKTIEGIGEENIKLIIEEFNEIVRTV